MTKYDPLDLLGSTVGGAGYEDLLDHSEKIDLGGETCVFILDLPTLIAIKEKLGRDRDRAVFQILRRTHEERDRRPQGWPLW
jgi:hypothetical protein